MIIIFQYNRFNDFDFSVFVFGIELDEFEVPDVVMSYY